MNPKYQGCDGKDTHKKDPLTDRNSHMGSPRTYCFALSSHRHLGAAPSHLALVHTSVSHSSTLEGGDCSGNMAVSKFI